MEGGAYGAGKAGGAFDPQTFIRQPHTVLRMVSWALWLKVLQATGSLPFPVRFVFDLGLVHTDGRRRCRPEAASSCDVSFVGGGLWAFFWFVGFCFLANQWQVTKMEQSLLNEGADAARAAIAFSFFSIFTWAGQAVLAYQRYTLGSDSALFSQDYMDPSQDQGPPYPPYASNEDLDPSTGYQQPPMDAYEAGTQGYQSQDY
ncbi:synaptogyrin-1 [Hyperolius riggenbachi]|uniref:synaptogyrin-1 n=1 Tax=Hyperolius riggenbachi TaxID=752182 RepID=UPI0035A2B214